MAAERVLVVDDDSAILTLAHRILEAAGYTVVQAKRGEEALAKLEQEPFDLLLTDIRLPGLNGLDVTARLRERGLELPVVTMTGYSNMEMAIQALSLGVDEFIVKPFTPDILRLHVARALEKGRLRVENLRLRTLVPLLQTAQGFAATRTRDDVFGELFAAARFILGTEEFAFLEPIPESKEWSIAAAEGARLGSLRGSAVPAIEPGRMEPPNNLRVWNQQETPYLPGILPAFGWMVAAPLYARDKRLGTLLAAAAAEPIQSDVEALNLICSQAAAALENVDLIAEISRAYLNARELERLKTEFINIAGHELRTPLAVVLGYAALVRERVNGELIEYADQIVASAQRLQRIADDMLNLKYLEAGQVELRLENCAVDQVVQQIVNAYQNLAMEREQLIETVIADEVGDLTADRAMLDLMLGSLLSNAIKFSPRQSRVRVRAEGDADTVTFVIEDQGVGLTPEQLEHIFDAFYQAGSSLTRREGGLGLGLTLTREVVRAHGGRIWVESEHNRGSSFHITLPRAHPPGRQTSDPNELEF